MKRFTITALSILFLAQAAFAAPVDRNTAQNAAASFFNTSTAGLYGQQALDFTLAYESKTSLSAVAGSEIPLFYVFNATNTEGFVIISADDAVLTDGDILVQTGNGANVYFKVAPYFQGNTGTYRLDLQVTRTALTGTDQLSDITPLTLYPNPAHNRLTLSAADETVELGEISIYDAAGKRLFSGQFAGNRAECAENA